MKKLLLIAWMLLALVASAPAQSTPGERDIVVIVLHSEATVEDSVIYLDQIAKISGGSTSLRQRVARFDVGELKPGVDRAYISSDQVRFRLLLAGIDLDRVRISGVKRTLVRESDEPVTQRKVIATAESAVRSRYLGDLSKVVILPLHGVTLPIIPPGAAKRIRLEATVRQSVPRFGRVRVDVEILVDGTPRDTIPMTLEITNREPLELTTLLSPKETKAPPAAGVNPKQTPSPTAAPPKAEVVIKNRETVRLIAPVGPVQVIDLGEAQEDGRVGDIIRVRNVNSGRIVSGRVEARGMVIVGNQTYYTKD